MTTQSPNVRYGGMRIAELSGSVICDVLAQLHFDGPDITIKIDPVNSHLFNAIVHTTNGDPRLELSIDLGDFIITARLSPSESAMLKETQEDDRECSLCTLKSVHVFVVENKRSEVERLSVKEWKFASDALILKPTEETDSTGAGTATKFRDASKLRLAFEGHALEQKRNPKDILKVFEYRFTKKV